MRVHDVHVSSLFVGTDGALVLGVAGGRVPYQPDARWLYSLRVLCLCWKVEVLWTTGAADRSER